ncbi:MAG: DsbA family protein [Steroidobacterales bacterium]
MTRHQPDLVVPVMPVDHGRGALHPRVTIVEYGDFECSLCRAAEPGVRMVLNHFTAEVRLVYRHFLIESAHPHALLAAEAAEAAAAQGKFWEMHDHLMRDGVRLDRASLQRYAEELELDTALFQSSLDDEIYRQRVREQMEGAVRSHLRATPGFFVNGYVCDVSGGIHALSERVSALL